jgi:hypothetical protein
MHRSAAQSSIRAVHAATARLGPDNLAAGTMPASGHLAATARDRRHRQPRPAGRHHRVRAVRAPATDRSIYESVPRPTAGAGLDDPGSAGGGAGYPVTRSQRRIAGSYSPHATVLWPTRGPGAGPRAVAATSRPWPFGEQPVSGVGSGRPAPGSAVPAGLPWPAMRWNAKNWMICARAQCSSCQCRPIVLVGALPLPRRIRAPKSPQPAAACSVTPRWHVPSRERAGSTITSVVLAARCRVCGGFLRVLERFAGGSRWR